MTAKRERICDGISFGVSVRVHRAALRASYLGRTPDQLACVRAAEPLARQTAVLRARVHEMQRRSQRRRVARRVAQRRLCVGREGDECGVELKLGLGKHLVAGEIDKTLRGREIGQRKPGARAEGNGSSTSTPAAQPMPVIPALPPSAATSVS